jgi:hypothetical protein
MKLKRLGLKLGLDFEQIIFSLLAIFLLSVN